MKKNIKYEYNGELYTASELEKFITVDGLSVENVRSRLSNGFSVERAISQPTNVKIQPKGVGERIYEYNGKIYNSFELTQISKVEGLNISHITSRINSKGWSVERAITQPIKNYKNKYEYNGNLYSTKELSKISPCCIPVSRIRERLKLGWSVDDAINIPISGRQKMYLYNGEYFSLVDLVEKFNRSGLPNSTVYGRIEKGWNIEKALTTHARGSVSSYDYNGKLYTLSELFKLSNVDGLTKDKLARRIREGMSIDDAINKPLGRYDSYLFNGNIYTLDEICELVVDKTISKECIQKRISDGWNLEDIINTPKNTKRKQYYK